MDSMVMNEDAPFFSIIIPTRDRVELFKIALQSAVDQSFSDAEIIVVNDGSTGDQLKAYQELEGEYPRVNFNYLVHRPNGHGQSYSMNYGADKALGKYLCFLDDDDYWTDPDHLGRAHESLSKCVQADLYYTNQTASFPDGSRNPDSLWIEDLNDKLDSSTADQQGSHQVSVEFLLQSRSFAHLNCSIFRKEFYFQIGGMDENIRYECDRDIYIRSLDQANLILFNPAVVSHHNIPDKNAGANMSTTVTSHQKRLYQLTLSEKGLLFSARSPVRKYCRTAKGHHLKFLAESFAGAGDVDMALLYAKQAQAVLPGVKWWLFTTLLRLKAIFR